jgi:cellulose 1,4-beta-cellobiosidase
MLTLAAASALFFALGANAQAPVYGQCGGTGWTGPTTCWFSQITLDCLNTDFLQVPPGLSARLATVSSHCIERKDYGAHSYTAYYSQCLPGSASPTTNPTTPPVSSPTSGSGTTAPTSAPTDAGNPYTGYNVFLIPEYVDEVKAAVAKLVLTLSNRQAEAQ